LNIRKRMQLRRQKVTNYKRRRGETMKKNVTARDLREKLDEAVNEAAYTVDKLKELVGELADTRPMTTISRPLTYKFSTYSLQLLKAGKQFNYLVDNASDTLAAHVASPPNVVVGVNRDTELYDAVVEVKGQELHITGYGGEEEEGGTATIVYKKHDKYNELTFSKVAKDDLDGIVIGDRPWLQSISWDVSDELFKILVGTFGPSS